MHASRAVETVKDVFQRLSIIYLLLLVLGGCDSDVFDDPDEYLTWLNDPGHGLVKKIDSNGMSISIRYMPPEYQAYLAMRGQGALNNKQKENLIAEHRNSMSFLITITHDDRLSHGKEGSNRTYPMATATTEGLNSDGCIGLKADGILYKPALIVPDHTNGLGASLNMTLVFIDDQQPSRLLACKRYDLIFNGEDLGMWNSHFEFFRQDLDDRKILKL